MPQITPNQVAVGCGAGGVMADVSAFMAGPEGVVCSYGQQDEFRDAGPAQFSFTLENQDGRFTPNNTRFQPPALTPDPSHAGLYLTTDPELLADPSHAGLYLIGTP